MTTRTEWDRVTTSIFELQDDNGNDITDDLWVQLEVMSAPVTQDTPWTDI